MHEYCRYDYSSEPFFAFLRRYAAWYNYEEVLAGRQPNLTDAAAAVLELRGTDPEYVMVVAVRRRRRRRRRHRMPPSLSCDRGWALRLAAHSDRVSPLPPCVHVRVHWIASRTRTHTHSLSLTHTSKHTHRHTNTHTDTQTHTRIHTHAGTTKRSTRPTS